MYDAIVIGSRCAGAPTAMLLARRGRRVLVVDRATFPSDVLSGHTIQPAGTARLARWGLLDRVRATGSPFLDTVRFDFGPVVLEGKPAPDRRHQRRHLHPPHRSSTRCSPTPPPRPAPRCARASPSRSCSGTTAGWSASGAATPRAPPSRSAPPS